MRPCFLAARRPSLVRPDINRLAKIAIAAITWNTSSPVAEVVSMSSTRPIRLIYCASGVSTVSRSSRGGRVTARVSSGRTQSSNAARPGRSNVRPEKSSANTRTAPLLDQAVPLSGQVLVRGRDPRISEEVSRSGHAVPHLQHRFGAGRLGGT